MANVGTEAVSNPGLRYVWGVPFVGRAPL